MRFTGITITLITGSHNDGTRKTSAVVEETREAVDTTSQPVATEKKSKNNTALILSAAAIAIALAAGVGLYGWGKQQAVNQTATSDAPLTN